MRFTLFFIILVCVVGGGAFYMYSTDNAKTKTFENWEITIKGIEKTKSHSVSSGKEGWTYRSREGETYIIARLSVKNKGKNMRTFYLADEIHLTYGEGQDFIAEDLFLDDERINGAKINSQEIISGLVVFQVPDSMDGKKAKLIFGAKNKTVSFSL